MYRLKWKGNNLTNNKKLVVPELPNIVVPCDDNNNYHEILFSKRTGTSRHRSNNNNKNNNNINNFRLLDSYKDSYPPTNNTTYYNYQEIALCVALRIFLKTKTLFYDLESFDRLYLGCRQYQCNLSSLDFETDSVYKTIIIFLRTYLLKYKAEVAEILHFTCRVLKIPPYHIFRSLPEFMYVDKSLKRACVYINSHCLIPKTNERLRECDMVLHQTYCNEYLLFLLIHRATVVSPSHFIEYSLYLIYFVFSNALKEPNKKVNAKIHITMKDAFINLYSLFNKNEKKKWTPALTRISYYYYTINQIKLSYILTFNYFMSEFKPFHPVSTIDVVGNDSIDLNNGNRPVFVCEAIHFYNNVDIADIDRRMNKLTNKVNCDYINKLRNPYPIKPTGWSSECFANLFEMPKVEIMDDLKCIFFIPSIVIHVTTPTRVPNKDEMRNKRYAWQICKFNGLTSSGYSQRRDPSGHVYSMNIAGGTSNGRTKLLLLYTEFFNRIYNSMIPNQQIHTDVDNLLCVENYEHCTQQPQKKNK